MSAIVACKIDELTTDLVCCDIVTDSGDGQQTRTVHEEISCFKTVMVGFEALPGFNKQWREAVIFPPNAT